MDCYSHRTLTSMAENNLGLTHSDESWRELISKENRAEMQRWEKNLLSNSGEYGTRTFSSVFDKDPQLAYFATKHNVPRSHYKPRNIKSARPSVDSRKFRDVDASKVRDIETRMAQMEMQVTQARSESARLRRQLASLTGKLEPTLPSVAGTARASSARSSRR